MSKTREIEFWVEPEDIENLTMRMDASSVLRLYTHKDAVSKNGQLVKLLQPIPEKKVEITESQFDEAWKHITETYSIGIGQHERIKQVLGFGDAK